eukprot:2676312-Alexandrium_andersonii.AAC.1
MQVAGSLAACIMRAACRESGLMLSCGESDGMQHATCGMAACRESRVESVQQRQHATAALAMRQLAWPRSTGPQDH